MFPIKSTKFRFQRFAGLKDAYFWLFAFLLTACLFETRPPDSPEPITYYETSVEGLPEASPHLLRDLKSGDSLDMTATAVRKDVQGLPVRMLAFDGSVPGPTFRVRQGDSVTVRLRNRSGVPVTLHPHGLRLPFRFDGTVGLSQSPIEDGDDYVYRLVFPDPGIYWYHSHFREDMAKSLGLYGNYLVAPKDTAYWSPVDREVVLVVNEVRMDSGVGITPFRKERADHVMMGRFGNVFLVNGDTAYTLRVKRKEYVRFYITNACNTRVLNFVTNRHMMKVVGSDHGKLATSVISGGEILSPGERVILEVAFRDSGTVQLFHQLPDRMMLLGKVEVGADSVDTPHHKAWMEETSDSALVAEIEALRPLVLGAPQKEILLTGTMDGHTLPIEKKAAPIDPAAALAKKAHDGWLGVEWYDTMGVMNSSSTNKNTHWVIRDRKTGKQNHAIDWNFKKDQRTFVRIVNDSLAVHSMAHPIHFHGQRFAVLTVNGKPVEAPLSWKDTYLVGAGFTVDLVLETTNPGTWMAHCHISEHMEGHMMFHFKVEE